MDTSGNGGSSSSGAADEAIVSETAEEPVAEIEETPQEVEQQSAVEEPDVRGILNTTQDRVSQILTATEAAAADIVDAANAESERIVRETHAKSEELAQSKMARIDSVTDALLAKASAVAEEIEALRELVDTSITTLGEELGVSAVTKASAPVIAYEPEPLPVSAGEVEDEIDLPQSEDVGDQGGAKGGLLHRMRTSTKRDASEGVKMLAAQMIAAGHTWEEARVRLSDEFGVKDPTVALDAVYREESLTS
jgi:hypothetical protein